MMGFDHGAKILNDLAQFSQIDPLIGPASSNWFNFMKKDQPLKKISSSMSEWVC